VGTGTTTSGCARATVVGAFSLNHRVVLAEEARFGRGQASHAVSLCDMHAKYADVMQVDDVLSYFDTIPEGQFDLPSGTSQSKPVRKLAAE
jgi:maleamate amidohydrolase